MDGQQKRVARQITKDGTLDASLLFSPVEKNYQGCNDKIGN
jgi:hypothetical protein